MKGSEFKRIRHISGFTAKEFAQSIGKSASYVYNTLEQNPGDIPPRREEEFIAFLGPSIYQKSRRIFELEQENQVLMMKKAEESTRLYEENRLSREDAERISRQVRLDMKKQQRDLDLEQEVEQILERNSRIHSELTPTGNGEAKAEAPNDNENASSEGNAFEEKMSTFMGILEKSRKGAPEDELSPADEVEDEDFSSDPAVSPSDPLDEDFEDEDSDDAELEEDDVVSDGDGHGHGEEK